MQEPQFSRTFGYSGSDAEITIREGVPNFLRYWITEVGSNAGISVHTMRTIVCGLLRVVPDANNWSEGNVASEVEGLLANCPWYRIYDIIEGFSRAIGGNGERSLSAEFTDAINQYFREEGVGWKLDSGTIVSRGDEEFEIQTITAASVLREAGYPTATLELHQAIADL